MDRCSEDMDFRQYRFLVYSDLYRIVERPGTRDFLRTLLQEPGFRYCFLLRTCRYLRSRPLLKYTLYPIARFLHSHYTFKYGISISPATSIGSGFYIAHFGGIVVNTDAIIGKNCNLNHVVTIAQTNRGERKGVPVIGDNVYIGPGAKIIGKVKVGNNAAIGANCVVTKDVPENAVVVGVPGKVISYKGSAGYVNRTDYETDS